MMYDEDDDNNEDDYTGNDHVYVYDERRSNPKRQLSSRMLSMDKISQNLSPQPPPTTTIQTTSSKRKSSDEYNDSKVQKMIERYNKNMSQRMKQLEEKDEEINMLSEEVNKWKSDCSILDDRIKDLSKQLASSQKQLSEDTTTSSDEHERNRILSEQLVHKNSIISELEQKCSSMVSDFDNTFNKMKEDLQRHIDHEVQLSNNYQTLKQENHILNLENESLKTLSMNQMAKINELQSAFTLSQKESEFYMKQRDQFISLNNVTPTSHTIITTPPSQQQQQQQIRNNSHTTARAYDDEFNRLHSKYQPVDRQSSTFSTPNRITSSNKQYIDNSNTGGDISFATERNRQNNLNHQQDVLKPDSPSNMNQKATTSVKITRSQQKSSIPFATDETRKERVEIERIETQMMNINMEKTQLDGELQKLMSTRIVAIDARKRKMHLERRIEELTQESSRLRQVLKDLNRLQE
jgi:hypothetical protein